MRSDVALAQVIVSNTELLLQAGCGMPPPAATAACSPAAALLPEPSVSSGFAAVRVGETTASLRCAQLQRGWREPLALVVRTVADAASAGFTSHLDRLRDGAAATLAVAARLQQAKAAAESNSELSTVTASAEEHSALHDKLAADSAQSPSVDHAHNRLPAPSPATAAAYPTNDMPDAVKGQKPVQAAFRLGFRRAVGPEDSGKVLLQARLHVASTTAELTQGFAPAAALLRATIAGAGLSGASPSLPAAPRSSSAAATPLASATIAEHGDAPRQPAQTPTSASVWLPHTDGGTYGGGVFANVPWQLSMAFITAEVAPAIVAEGGEIGDAAHGNQHSIAGSGSAAISVPVSGVQQTRPLRQLVKIGQLTVDVVAMAQQQLPSGEPLAAVQLQGDRSETRFTTALNDRRPRREGCCGPTF